ncbi:MAG TPA: histidine kinase [Gemmatimonadaceae bacterium]|nr:histidine kinase [Gemmatimonadaceae bacterium]
MMFRHFLGHMDSSTIGSLRYDDAGSRRHTTLLSAVLILAALLVAVLSFQTWQTARAHRDASAKVVQDYSSFAAWSFASRIRSASFLAVNPVFAGADRVPQQVVPVLRGMWGAADSLQACACGIDLWPRVFFLINLDNGTYHVEKRDSALSDDEIERRIAEIRSVAGRSLAKGVTSREPGALPYRSVAARSGDDAWLAFYAVRFRATADRGLIVGFEMPAKRFADVVVAPALRTAALLPPSLTRSAPVDSLLSAEVRIPGGEAIYRSAPMHSDAFTSIEPIGEPDTTLTAIVSINPSSASRLIIGGVPQSPIRTVLPLVSLAIALLGLALYLTSRRETAALQLRARLSEARLGALRGQLQPHFLFNVLNSIAMLARKGDNKAVVTTLTRLSDLLRLLLRDSPREEVPLRAELEFITHYLALEKTRFQDQLDIEIDMPDELMDSLVPTLILQPLVENALRHGVGAREGRGRIEIRATRSGDMLRIDVADNGPGLNAVARNGDNGGIGLPNSRERLAQLYHGSASLHVRDSETGGVVSTLTLPFAVSRRA